MLQSQHPRKTAAETAAGSQPGASGTHWHQMVAASSSRDQHLAVSMVGIPHCPASPGDVKTASRAALCRHMTSICSRQKTPRPTGRRHLCEGRQALRSGRRGWEGLRVAFAFPDNVDFCNNLHTLKSFWSCCPLVPF